MVKRGVQHGWNGRSCLLDTSDNVIQKFKPRKFSHQKKGAGGGILTVHFKQIKGSGEESFSFENFLGGQKRCPAWLTWWVISQDVF